MAEVTSRLPTRQLHYDAYYDPCLSVSERLRRTVAADSRSLNGWEGEGSTTLYKASEGSPTAGPVLVCVFYLRDGAEAVWPNGLRPSRIGFLDSTGAWSRSWRRRPLAESPPRTPGDRSCPTLPPMSCGSGVTRRVRGGLREGSSEFESQLPRDATTLTRRWLRALRGPR